MFLISNYVLISNFVIITLHICMLIGFPFPLTLFISYNLHHEKVIHVYYCQTFRKRWSFKTGDLLKRGLIHMKFYITGQEKGDHLV